VIVLEPGWELSGEGIHKASDPKEAVELALRLAAQHAAK
jgi:hypothetical protein